MCEKLYEKYYSGLVIIKNYEYIFTIVTKIFCNTISRNSCLFSVHLLLTLQHHPNAKRFHCEHWLLSLLTSYSTRRPSLYSVYNIEFHAQITRAKENSRYRYFVHNNSYNNIRPPKINTKRRNTSHFDRLHTTATSEFSTRILLYNV